MMRLVQIAKDSSGGDRFDDGRIIIESITSNVGFDQFVSLFSPFFFFVAFYRKFLETGHRRLYYVIFVESFFSPFRYSDIVACIIILIRRRFVRIFF